MPYLCLLLSVKFIHFLAKICIVNSLFSCSSSRAAAASPSRLPFPRAHPTSFVVLSSPYSLPFSSLFSSLQLLLFFLRLLLLLLLLRAPHLHPLLHLFLTLHASSSPHVRHSNVLIKSCRQISSCYSTLARFANI